MARSGVLPLFLGSLGNRHTPHHAILVVLGIVGMVIPLGDIALVAQVANFSMLVSFALVNISASRVLTETSMQPRLGAVWRLQPWAGAVSCLALATLTGGPAVALGLCLMGLGFLYSTRAPHQLRAVFLGLVLLAASPFAAGSALQSLAQSACAQPAREGCAMELGTAVSAIMVDPADTHTWWLHLDAPGTLYVLLANLHADYGVAVVPVRAPFFAESAAVGDSVAFASIHEAPAGDYLISVQSRSGEVSDQPYLLLASWQPSPPETAMPVANAQEPSPQPAPTPREDRPVVPPPVVASTVPPAAPSGLRARALPSTRIELAWTDNSAHEAGFWIADDLGNSFALGANATSYVTEPNGAGRTACFRVRAFNTGGHSAWTESACAGAPALSVPGPVLPAPPPIVAPLPPPLRLPLPPSGLRATAMNWHTIRLDWTSRSENVTGFFVDGIAGYFPVSGHATTVNVGGLSPSTRYCFRVTAFNPVGEAASDETCATTLDPPTPPPQP
jgi:hypothetical protein